jgi:hypothetical protein
MAGGPTQKVALVHWADYEPFARGPEEPVPPLPICRILVERGFRRRSAAALIDSGSVVSILPRHLAAALGCLPTEFETEVMTPTGSFMAADVPLKARLFLSAEVIQISFCVFVVPAPGHEFPFVVMGQEPLFHMAEVRFRSWESRFGLSRTPPAWMGGHVASKPPRRRRGRQGPESVRS